MFLDNDSKNLLSLSLSNRILNENQNILLMKFGYTALFLITGIFAFNNAAYAHGELNLESLDLDKLVETYNQNLKKVPGFVKNIFGNEKINLYIDGELFVGLAGEGGKIVEYKKGGLDKPTMKVFTTSDTIDKLMDGDKTLLEAVKDKSVSYEGIGFVSKIKFGFIKIFQRLLLRG